ARGQAARSEVAARVLAEAVRRRDADRVSCRARREGRGRGLPLPPLAAEPAGAWPAVAAAGRARHAAGPGAAADADAHRRAVTGAQAARDGAPMSRARKAAFVLFAIALSLFGARPRVSALVGQQAGNCIGDINRLTNPNGFTTSDFQSSNAVVVSNGSAQAAQLDTNLVPLDPQK